MMDVVEIRFGSDQLNEMARQRTPVTKRTTFNSKHRTFSKYSLPRKSPANSRSAQETSKTILSGKHHVQRADWWAFDLGALARVVKSPILSRNASRGFSLGRKDDLEKTPFGVPGDEGRDTSDEKSSDSEDWEDGATLVAKFMDVDPEAVEADTDELMNLVDGLKGPFSKAGAALRKDITEVFYPTLAHIRETHDMVTNGPDKVFREGSQKFLESAMWFSDIQANQQKVIHELNKDAQVSTLELFKRLKDAYQRIEASKAGFLNKIKAKVQFAMEDLEEFDEELEKMEARANKRLKDIQKDKQRQKNEDLLKIFQFDD
ncbi:hypothetical protein FRB91_000206 [Serendipita sp. 411]|nr:hypothetical protein FRC16_009582 [Serendipita sp. 398]KAG8856868.1 hypothetical protein FRB91_000206 [Serendipita sp. 411]